MRKVLALLALSLLYVVLCDVGFEIEIRTFKLYPPFITKGTKLYKAPGGLWDLEADDNYSQTENTLEFVSREFPEGLLNSGNVFCTALAQVYAAGRTLEANLDNYHDVMEPGVLFNGKFKGINYWSQESKFAWTPQVTVSTTARTAWRILQTLASAERQNEDGKATLNLLFKLSSKYRLFSEAVTAVDSMLLADGQALSETAKLLMFTLLHYLAFDDSIREVKPLCKPVYPKAIAHFFLLRTRANLLLKLIGEHERRWLTPEYMYDTLTQAADRIGNRHCEINGEAAFFNELYYGNPPGFRAFTLREYLQTLINDNKDLMSPESSPLWESMGAIDDYDYIGGQRGIRFELRAFATGIMETSISNIATIYNIVDQLTHNMQVQMREVPVFYNIQDFCSIQPRNLRRVTKFGERIQCQSSCKGIITKWRNKQRGNSYCNSLNDKSKRDCKTLLYVMRKARLASFYLDSNLENGEEISLKESVKHPNKKSSAPLYDEDEVHTVCTAMCA